MSCYQTFAMACMVSLVIASSATAADDTYDVVIVNGRVMDPESGLDAVRNVGLRAGKIAALSTEAIQGRRTLDAKGLVVAPGFIDLHEHGQKPDNYEFQAHDGVTTSLELEAGTGDVAGWYAEREGKSLINFGVSVGHIPTRMKVMKDPAPGSPREMRLIVRPLTPSSSRSTSASKPASSKARSLSEWASPTPRRQRAAKC